MSVALNSPAVDRRWWLALAASLLVHALVLSSPGWQLPSLDDLLNPDKEERIEARLALPPAPPAPPPVALAEPSPARLATVKPASSRRPTVSPAPTFSPPPAQATAAPVVEAVAPPAPAVAKPVATAPLPRRARIRFAIIRGEQGFVVGRSEHRWTLDGNAYTLRAVAETTGIAALFRPATVTQISEGELLAEGLRPRSFRVERGGAAGDTASFDWAAGRVAMNPGPRDAVAEPGMQDMLSMFWQLGLLPVVADGVGMTVATGKKIERFVFTLVGEEKIATPLGEKAALHIKTVGTAGGDATEIWIGVDKRLPLRIRHIDRKGESFDQVVEEMEIE
ncbi:MAG: DUF3108 domain-containing protein [Sulfurisoma sp.]|nr:DUF3108 domain-containing protein [Sulfurisoma sp.]